MVKNLHKTSALFLEDHQQDQLHEKSTTQEESSPMSNMQRLQKSKSKYKWKIVWKNVIIFLYFHISAVYGAYLLLTVAKWYTIIFCEFFNFDFPLLRYVICHRNLPFHDDRNKKFSFYCPKQK